MHYGKETAVATRTWEIHFLDGSPWVGLWWDGFFEEAKSFVTSRGKPLGFLKGIICSITKKLNVAGESKEFC